MAIELGMISIIEEQGQILILCQQGCIFGSWWEWAVQSIRWLHESTPVYEGNLFLKVSMAEVRIESDLIHI